MFFFFFFGPVWPWGWVNSWPCHKGQARTCQLVAISMFESGPYGRDPKCSTRGLGENHKVWNISFLHDKIRTFQTLFFPTCSSQVRIGPLPLQTFLCFFFSLCFFLAQFGPPLNMPIGTNRHVRPRANTGWSKEKKKKKRKKKEDKLAFSFRQREKLKPGFKPCSSQWAPLEYTDLDLILVETTTYFPLNVFLIFCEYLSCIPPTGSLPVHRNRRLFGEEPQLIPRPLFLLFVNQDQNMYYFDRMYQCMYWNICWFSSTHTLISKRWALPLFGIKTKAGAHDGDPCYTG